MSIKHITYVRSSCCLRYKNGDVGIVWRPVYTSQNGNASVTQRNKRLVKAQGIWPWNAFVVFVYTSFLCRADTLCFTLDTASPRLNDAYVGPSEEHTSRNAAGMPAVPRYQMSSLPYPTDTRLSPAGYIFSTDFGLNIPQAVFTHHFDPRTGRPATMRRWYEERWRVLVGILVKIPQVRLRDVNANIRRPIESLEGVVR